jgi:hypothetical protein
MLHRPHFIHPTTVLLDRMLCDQHNPWLASCQRDSVTV